MTLLPLDKTNLNDLIAQCRHLNIFPIYLSRYYPKPFEHPVSNLLERLVEEARDYLDAMTPAEVDILVDECPSKFKMYLDSSLGLSTAVRSLERIALYYLAAKVDECYWSLKEVVTNTLVGSSVLKTFPELSDRLDKDGLLELDDQTTLFDAGIEYNDHILQFHQFFRRGFQSNLNFDFLGRFIHYYRQSKTKNKFRIAIDLSRLMPKNLFQQIFERDVWYGPRFDRNKLDDRNATGLTILKRRKPSVFDPMGQLDRTEFYWSYKEGVKTLQVEEISDREYFFDPYYINRYAHSERNIETKRLVHFDGAAKVYLRDNYSGRIESNFPKEPRSYKKIKLFRIDGDIDIDRWQDLLGFFFRQNEMIVEYFNPEQFEKQFGEQIRKYEALRLRQLTGVRLKIEQNQLVGVYWRFGSRVIELQGA